MILQLLTTGYNLYKNRKAMMMSAGPFFMGMVLGLIIGIALLYWLFMRGTLACPGLTE